MYEDLIDRALIDTAQAKLADLITRRGPAADAVTAAGAAHTSAKQAYDAALLTGDGHAARQAMDDAERRLAVARDVPGALDAAIKLAERDLKTATGAAHQRMHDAAVADAVAACRRGDEARAALDTAADDFRAAVAAIRHATAAGAFPACRGEHPDGSSPSLTRMDGAWTLPTGSEAAKRFNVVTEG